MCQTRFLIWAIHHTERTSQGFGQHVQRIVHWLWGRGRRRRKDQGQHSWWGQHSCWQFTTATSRHGWSTRAQPIYFSYIVNRKITGIITSLEGRLEECIQGVSECVSHAELESKCKANEERANYRIARECDRTKKQLEVTIQDLGQSMVDCLKRCDLQIDQKLNHLFQPYPLQFAIAQALQ